MALSALASLALAATLAAGPNPVPNETLTAPNPTGASPSATSGETSMESSQNNVGERTDFIQIEINPGAGPISLIWAERSGLSRAVWGSSYATSKEIFFLYYEGKAKAGGNVYQNERIVTVCIWYSSGPERVSDEVCSRATSNTVAWFPGPEVVVGAFDSLDWDAPKTILNIKTTRISPTVFP